MGTSAKRTHGPLVGGLLFFRAASSGAALLNWKNQPTKQTNSVTLVSNLAFKYSPLIEYPFGRDIVTYVEDFVKNYKLRFEPSCKTFKTIVSSAGSALKEMKEIFELKP